MALDRVGFRCLNSDIKQEMEMAVNLSEEKHKTASFSFSNCETLVHMQHANNATSIKCDTNEEVNHDYVTFRHTFMANLFKPDEESATEKNMTSSDQTKNPSLDMKGDTNEELFYRPSNKSEFFQTTTASGLPVSSVNNVRSLGIGFGIMWGPPSALHVDSYTCSQSQKVEALFDGSINRMSGQTASPDIEGDVNNGLEYEITDRHVISQTDSSLRDNIGGKCVGIGCFKIIPDPKQFDEHAHGQTGVKPALSTCQQGLAECHRSKDDLLLHTTETPWALADLVCRPTGHSYATLGSNFGEPLRLHEEQNRRIGPINQRDIPKGPPEDVVQNPKNNACGSPKTAAAKKRSFGTGPYGIGGDRKRRRTEENGSVCTGDRPHQACDGSNLTTNAHSQSHISKTNKGDNPEIVAPITNGIQDPVSNERNFTCEICGKSFSHQTYLTKHYRGKCFPFKKRPFICDVCGRRFRKRPHLVEHRRIHTGEKPYVCEKCGKRFKQESAFRNHRRDHHEEKVIRESFICDVCGRSYTTSQGLKLHSSLHATEKTFLCEICGKAFNQDQKLVSHLNSHKTTKLFECGECGKMFKTGGNLRKHSLTHKTERPVACDLCGKRFIFPCSMRIHRRSHTGEKPFVCKTCGKGFSQQGRLKEHERTHTDERPHVCDTCGKAFRGRSDLTVHRRLHTGEKPYVCTLCGEAFIVSYGLRMHHSRKHADTNAGN